MIEKIYESKFARLIITLYSKIAASHLKIGIETKQKWDDIGNKSDKYIKNIFNKYFNLLESLKELHILQEIVIQEKFPKLESVPDDYSFVYYLRFYYQLYKIKLISVLDITARVMLSVYNLNYNFHKINLKNFNKEPLFQNTDSLRSFRAFWNDFLDIRNTTRNIIVHEGGYKSSLIEKIDELTLEPGSIISDSEYFNEWFNTQRQEKIDILKSEVTQETELVIRHLVIFSETLINPMETMLKKIK